MGELLAELPKATAGRPPKIGTPEEPISPPTLAEQGVKGRFTGGASAEPPKAEGGRPLKTGAAEEPVSAPTLAAQGITPSGGTYVAPPEKAAEKNAVPSRNRIRSGGDNYKTTGTSAAPVV